MAFVDVVCGGGKCFCCGKVGLVEININLFHSNTDFRRVFCTFFLFFFCLSCLPAYECLPEQSAALCVGPALGTTGVWLWVGLRCYWSANIKIIQSYYVEMCGAGHSTSSLLLAFSRKSKRKMSGYWRNMVTVWWTTTKRGSRTLRLNLQVSSEVVGTIPRWACWRDVSCQKISSLTAASKHWVLCFLVRIASFLKSGRDSCASM